MKNKIFYPLALLYIFLLNSCNTNNFDEVYNSINAE